MDCRTGFIHRHWISGRLLDGDQIGDDSKGWRKEGAQGHRRGNPNDSGTALEHGETGGSDRIIGDNISSQKDKLRRQKDLKMTYNTINRIKIPIYKSRKGWVFGVCAGFAQTFNLSLFWIRTVLVLAFVFTGFFPVGLLYLLAALLMKVEPPREPKSSSEWEFYNSYASSKSLALARLKQRFERLDRRTRRLEDLVTAREYDWDRRLREG